MKNFEVYKSFMKAQGCEIQSQFNTKVKIDDMVTSGDILEIPKNVTVFAQVAPNGMCTTEFIVCYDEYGDLKRIYASWLSNGKSKGTMIDDINEFGNLNKFFAQNEGRKFTIKIKENTSIVDSSNRPKITRRFDWVN